MRALDVRPLVDPVDRADVLADHRARRRAARERSRGEASGASRVLGAVLGTTLLVVLAAVAAVCVVAVYGLLGVGLRALGVDLPLAVGLLAAGTAALVLLVVRGARRSSVRERERTSRLGRFAAANGFAFVPRVDEPDHPSAAFRVGILRRAVDVVRTPGPWPVEVGTYRYSAGYRASEPFAWSYATTTLDRALPHLVLETLPRDGSPGGRAPAGVERVREVAPGDAPEGPHRVHSTARLPAGTARAVLTPEVVALLVGGPVPLAAEVVDDRVLLYSERPLDLLDPAVWTWLLTTTRDVAAHLSGTARGDRPEVGPPRP